MDVTKEDDIEKCFKDIVLAFCGIDIIVNNAGISISKTITETTLQEWDLLQAILVKGQFTISRAALEIMRKQALGGDIVEYCK